MMVVIAGTRAPLCRVTGVALVIKIFGQSDSSNLNNNFGFSRDQKGAFYILSWISVNTADI
jgi:hypothetical protein